MTPDLSTVLETIAEQPTIFESLLEQAKEEAKTDIVLRFKWKAHIDNLMQSEAYDTFLNIDQSGLNPHTNRLKYELTSLYLSNDLYRIQIHQLIDEQPKYSPNLTPNPQPA